MSVVDKPLNIKQAIHFLYYWLYNSGAFSMDVF